MLSTGSAQSFKKSKKFVRIARAREGRDAFGAGGAAQRTLGPVGQTGAKGTRPSESPIILIAYLRFEFRASMRLIILLLIDQLFLRIFEVLIPDVQPLWKLLADMVSAFHDLISFPVQIHTVHCEAILM